jgi:Tol biopolymer transport system component/beta-lactamase regulating signal transducer with metallopeptidase domain
MEAVMTYSQAFFGWLLQTTLIVSMVICMILLIQKLLGGRLGPRWSYALWLVLLVRMILPWSPSSRVSLSNLIPSWQRQTQSLQLPDSAGQQNKSVPLQTSETPEKTSGQEPQSELVTQEQTAQRPQIIANENAQSGPRLVLLRRILPILWLAGAIVIGVYLLVSDLALWRIVKQDRPLINQAMLELFEECKAQIGVQSLVVVVPSDRVRSPGLFGFVRPRLLLPRQMLDTATTEEMRYVFLHELAHLRRHDIYLGWLTSLLQVLHWFNPLVWFAFYRMRADRELACDALVLLRMGQDKSQEYGGAIVELVRRFSRSRPLPAMAGIIESKSQLKRRIAMITKFRNKSYRFSPLSAVLIIILACISLPDAKHTKASETVASKPAHLPNFRQIQIPNRIRSDIRLSPDGKRIALISDNKLWIVPRSSRLGPDYPGAPKLLDTAGVEADRYSLTWSADGRWIAFNGNKVKEGNQCIYVVCAEGGKPKQVFENNRDVRVVNYRMSLSPHGKRIAFSSVTEGKVHIYLMSVDGGLPRQLVNAPAREPVFSPDGRMIAYVEDENLGRGGGGLWTVPADGGIPMLVANAENASSPVWSPDGRMVAFIDYEMPTQIYIVPIGENGKPTGEKITVNCPKGIEGVRRLTGWTPDNEIGAIFQSQLEFALFTQPIQGGKVTFLTYGGYPLQPRWSPDGKRIYHTNKTDATSGDWEAYAIAYVPAEGGDATTVPLHSEPKIRLQGYGSGNHISPDGKSIVFAGHKEGSLIPSMYIWILPIDGGTPRQLTNASLPFRDWYPCWSPNGRKIAFVRMKVPENWAELGEANIYIVSADGGEPRQITSESDRVFCASPVLWSPDGKLLAYFSRDKDDAIDGAIKVIPPDGGEPRDVARVKKVSANIEMAWSPNGKRIAFNEANVIKIVSLEDGNIEAIMPDLEHEIGIYHLDWSPDGQRFVFAGNKGGERQLWVMKNFLPEAPVAKPEPQREPMLRRIEVKGRGSVYSRPSFDGKYMSDVNRKTGNLVVRELATGKERMLTTESDPNRFAYESLISPDNKKVAFLQFNPAAKDFDLRVIGFDGSDLRTLLDSGRIAGYFNIDAWSPDGTYIYGRPERKPMELVRVSSNDSSMQVIKTFDQSIVSKTDISPDGRYLAYSRTTNKTSKPDIFVFDLERQEESPLVTSSSADKLLGWTPDGQSIFFASNRNGTWDGWLLPVVDGKTRGLPEMVKAGIGDVSPIGFTKAGAFYYGFEHEEWNVYTVMLDLGADRVLSEPSPVRDVGKDGCPDWSPDGRYLAYCSQPDSEKQQIVRIRTLRTGEERELRPDLPYFDWLRWCPDSRHLLITDFVDRSAVYRLDVQTGGYTALVQSDKQKIRGAELSADGKTLAYRIRGSGNSNWLMVRDLETGREKDVLQDKTTAPIVLSPFNAGWALAPDGKHIALSVREGETSKPLKPLVLKIMSIANGQTTTIAGPSISEMAWTSDSSNLVFVRHGNELWRVSAKGGEPEKLWEWERKQPLWGPRINPNAQRLAFYSGGYVSEMWVMENFLPESIAVAK